MQNEVVVAKLRQIGQLYTLERDEFRSSSYFKVAAIIERLETPLAATNLLNIRGIGQSTAKVIRDLEEKGTCDRLEGLLRKYPPGALALQAIPGVGSVTAYALAREYGVTTVSELIEILIKTGDDNELLGRAKEAELLLKRGRLPRETVKPFVEKMVKQLNGEPSIDRCVVAGSYRRQRDTIKDLDVLIQMRKGFKAPAIRLVVEKFGTVTTAGKRKIAVKHKGKFVLHMDFLIISPISWGSALCYFTGSKEHNIRLRRLAKSRGMKVNEYGIYQGTRRLGGEHEGDLYALLGLEFVSPWNRTE